MGRWGRSRGWGTDSGSRLFLVPALWDRSTRKGIGSLGKASFECHAHAGHDAGCGGGSTQERNLIKEPRREGGRLSGCSLCPAAPSAQAIPLPRGSRAGRLPASFSQGLCKALLLERLALPLQHVSRLHFYMHVYYPSSHLLSSPLAFLSRGRDYFVSAARPYPQAD